MVVSLYFGSKSHVSIGCKMYLLRSPAQGDVQTIEEAMTVPHSKGRKEVEERVPP